MSIFQINYYLNNTDNFNEESYNRDISNYWDNIRDFIILHYRSTRNDTEFWKEASSDKRLSNNLKSMLDIWKHRPPKDEDYGLFSKLALGNTLWLQILLGMNLLDKNMVKRDLIKKDLYDKSINEHLRVSKEIEYVTNNAISNTNFYLTP